MAANALTSVIASVPAGRWAVGVSGGADSVALLRLLCERADVTPHVVHLDHQTRQGESTADAAFVRELAGKLGLVHTLSLRSDVEATMSDLPANTSSRYRAVRLQLFRKTVTDFGLAGVALAHHADDQAETVFQRLLRGSGATGLAGMESDIEFGEFRIIRPLLTTRRDALRDYLQRIGQPWREDASNASDKYLRNRLRRLLAARADLLEALLALGDACLALREWARSSSPLLEESFTPWELADLPSILARESARRWLIEHGVPPHQVTPAVVQRLLAMCSDAAFSPRVHFPGGVLVRRRGGSIEVGDE